MGLPKRLIAGITGASGAIYGIRAFEVFVSHRADAGAILMPPVPAFYALPQTLHDVVERAVNRALYLFGLAPPGALRWTGGRDATTGSVSRAVCSAGRGR